MQGQPTTAGGETGVSVPNSASIRQPSATMAVVLVTQIQFLATLSLVDNTGTEESTVSDFADNLRWVNLWPPASFAESFTPQSVSNGASRYLVELASSSTSLQGGEHGGRDTSASTSESDSSMVFMGNFVLFVGLLLGIFFIHVFLASAVEAYWLAKVRIGARDQACGSAFHEQIVNGRSIFGERKLQQLCPAPQEGPGCECDIKFWQKRARETVGNAHRQGIPLRQLLAESSVRSLRFDRTAAESSQRSLLDTGRSDDGRGQIDDADEEERAPAVSRRDKRLNMNKIAECREKSQSAWLHFPHIELVFLLFAFEGAVVAQVSAIRENASPVVLCLAIGALLLFPVLMAAMVARTFFSKVKPDDHIVFKPCAHDTTDEVEGVLGGRTISFGSKVKTSLLSNNSMFGWADKGQWESVESSGSEGKTERDWFRIGFEPIFIDFTKKGSWFIIYSLIEWMALGIVGALVDDSVLQLSLFCAMNAVSFILLLVLKPFANRVINAMGIALYGSDAACMAILAVSADKWKGTARAKRADTAVMIVQLVTLAVLIIPIYVDTSFMMIGALGRKVRSKKKEEDQTDEEERKFTKRYVRAVWARIWCTMLGKNLFACFRDTSAGISQPSTRTVGARAPTGPTAARTGPYPPLFLGESVGSTEDSQPRRPPELGTLNTPVSVRPAPSD
ncbi:unnamed protein product [Hapterophycus canaliculatus]